MSAQALRLTETPPVLEHCTAPTDGRLPSSKSRSGSITAEEAESSRSQYVAHGC